MPLIRNSAVAFGSRFLLSTPAEAPDVGFWESSSSIFAANVHLEWSAAPVEPGI
jgi:hypothetical protein